MRAATGWTEAMDAILRELRAGGITWDEIARTMQLSRNIVLERARRIGARQIATGGIGVGQRALALPRAADAVDRPSRPAGHPLTWGLLTRHTPLEGTDYPYPVFL